MEQNVYWLISISLGTLALVVSVGSVILGLKNRAEQRRAFLFSKKTEILTKWVEAKAKLNHLAMIYAQKLQFIRNMDLGQSLRSEEERIRENLNLVMEQSLNAESQYDALIDIKPSDIEALESLLTTANSYIAHSSEELQKEQKAYDDLRQSVGQ